MGTVNWWRAVGKGGGLGNWEYENSVNGEDRERFLSKLSLKILIEGALTTENSKFYVTQILTCASVIALKT